jgi:hypothetical protein
MTYPNIIVHEKHAGGRVHLGGTTYLDIGSHNPAMTYATEDQVRRGATDWPGLDVEKAFGHVRAFHVLANPFHSSGIYLYLPRTIALGGLRADWNQARWDVYWAGTTAHELGHAFEAKWLHGDLRTAYYALRTHAPDGMSLDEWFAEDCRFVLGGPALQVHPHKLDHYSGGWATKGDTWARVKAVITEVVRRNGLAIDDKEEGENVEIPGLKLVRPVDENYPVTARFGDLGPRWTPYHHGTDFACPTGTAVRAVSGGVVAEVGESPGYGVFVKLRHDWGYSLYAHLNAERVYLQGCLSVQQGDIIAYSGSSGASAPHLHLEVRGPNGSLEDAFNAEPYIVAPAYPDVMHERWSAEAIEWCKSAGLMKGYPDGRFDPAGKVSREELATALWRMRGEG